MEPNHDFNDSRNEPMKSFVSSRPTRVTRTEDLFGTDQYHQQEQENINNKDYSSSMKQDQSGEFLTLESSCSENGINLGTSDHEASLVPEVNSSTVAMAELEKKTRKRGRKPALAEKERNRRNKHKDFLVALQALLPNAPKTHAEVLEGAVKCINDLKEKLQVSESQKKSLQTQIKTLKEASSSSLPSGLGQDYETSNSNLHGTSSKMTDLAINDLKVDGLKAKISIICKTKNHPAAILMVALKELNLDVVDVDVSVEEEEMVQKVTVKMGSTLYTEDQLRKDLLSKISD